MNGFAPGAGGGEFVADVALSHPRKLFWHRHWRLEQLARVVAEAPIGYEHGDGCGVQRSCRMEQLRPLKLWAIRMPYSS